MKFNNLIRLTLQLNTQFMKLKITLLLIVFIPLIIYSQNKVSKKEIYHQWNKSQIYFDSINNYTTQFDSIVVCFIKKLKSDGVDTFGIYSIEYPGYMSTDSCECGMYPWEAYVQWIKDGKTFHQKITKCCSYKPKIIENSILISYYNNNRININKERIMPVIKGASKGKGGEILFHMEDVDHNQNYTIFCSINGKSKLTAFEQFELENKNNLFYQENINSFIFKWRELIDKQINKIGR